MSDYKEFCPTFHTIFLLEQLIKKLVREARTLVRNVPKVTMNSLEACLEELRDDGHTFEHEAATLALSI